MSKVTVIHNKTKSVDEAVDQVIVSQDLSSELWSTARAGINIALIKYWGKQDAYENIPAVGSLSLTLSPWGSETGVRWSSDLTQHDVILNEERVHDKNIYKILDLIKQQYRLNGHAYVRSLNTVPTAAGLASSASGMAALVSATCQAIGVLPQDQSNFKPHMIDPHLIRLVRIGSGSAPRSLIGGWVHLSADGQKLTQIAHEDSWDLSLLVAVVDRGPKSISSRIGMERTKRTSPFYQAWIDSHAQDLIHAKIAVIDQDLEKLGTLMEHSTFKMHACMWASQPPLRYVKGSSIMVLDEVSYLRSKGTSAWATMDAGPHVKILCHTVDAETVKKHIESIPDVHEVLILKPGAGVSMNRQS